ARPRPEGHLRRRGELGARTTWSTAITSSGEELLRTGRGRGNVRSELMGTAARRRSHAFAGALALAVAGAAPRVASADPSSEERALADVRFREGRALLDAQRVDDACAKFEESYRLWPRGGTALNLGACREKQGKPATAWAAYAQALELARKEGRADR